VGSGSAGGMLVDVCHAYGAEPIVAVDIHEHCLDIARKRMGATHSLLAPDEKLTDSVNDLTRGEGVDVIFVTADEPISVTQGVEMAKRSRWISPSPHGERSKTFSREVLTILLARTTMKTPPVEIDFQWNSTLLTGN